MQDILEAHSIAAGEEFRRPVELEEVSDEEFRELLQRPPARFQYFFERRADASPQATALIAGRESLTYAQLEARANRLAHYLIAQGAGPGKTAGILLERSVHTYVALLAVLKSGAAFVPVDPGYPSDRVAFIAADAGFSVLVTTGELAEKHAGLACPMIAVDRAAAHIQAMPASRPAVSDEGDAPAYIIYTSGTTGRPKGVAVDHANICHFLSACTPVYGVAAGDRVYQGMTIAFDFSIEEIWPTFIAGGVLVAGPTDGRRLGPGLADFLTEHKITVLYCVPTLLATLDHDIPSLTTLIVGGEACPRDLVERWNRPGRRILNTYGPTETTVTATWSELEPGRAVTIGRPMPGYSVYIVDENLRAVAPGMAGEICIGGAGVARGYVNRPDLTSVRFVPDPFDGRSGARMYRSGDLGRFAPNGEIEFLGRIDTQVKIRGYRLELGEIEAVLSEDPAVENAVVAAIPADGPPQDLAAYVTLRAALPAGEVRQRLAEQLRRRLPVYMVPAYIEVLDAIPTLASGKADRKNLPGPVLPRMAARAAEYVPPAGATEARLAETWEALFGYRHISVEADFFLDLGGHSLFAAQLVSRLREQPETRHLSVADLYTYPTIRTLAGHIEERPAAPPPQPAPDIRRHSNARVWRAGVAQLVLLYGLLALLALPVTLFMAAHGPQFSMLHFTRWDLLLPGAVLALTFVLPVVLKWTFIGRFRPGRHPLWGWYYCRWWLVRKALEFSPLHFMAGSPMAVVYARLLGARIGSGCHIATAQLHLPDLIEIGRGAAIGYDAELHPFVVEDGWLEMAPVRIGAGAFVGTKAVILAGAQLGPGARVAEQSLVARGQNIPAGEAWAGSPSRRVNQPDALLDEMEKRPARAGVSGWLWAGFAAGLVVLEMLPMLAALPAALWMARQYYAHGLGGALAAAPGAGLMFVCLICLGVAAGKRLAMPHARPGIYPVASAFGLRKWLADQFMASSLALTNSLYATLYTLPWLRLLGARIGRRSEVSTVSHIDPDLLVLGEETFVADIASIGAAAFHHGQVALDRAEVGNRTFVGNAAVVRSHARLADNCLIGVQSVAPGQPARPGTAWLGSPAMFLPRRQVCDGFAERLTYRPTALLVAYRLAVELVRVVLPAALWFAAGLLDALAGMRLLQRTSGAVLVVAMPAVFLAISTAVTLLVAGMKWAIVGRYRPRVEPLWAPFVRHSELITGLYEGAAVPMLAGLLTGTPWIAPLLGAFGVRAGRRVYLETTYVTEFDLVRVGDDAAVGRATSLQTHLFEDRVMKMSTVVVGGAAAVGPRAVVLYDATVREGARLDALSLAMKGETIPAGARWCGVPARQA